MELPFPFPGAKKPTDRFDFHDRRTFTYMGREGFQRILRELPAPPVYVDAALDATLESSKATSASTSAAGSSATSAAYLKPPPMKTDFFPPIRCDIFQRSIETFVYGTIGWGLFLSAFILHTCAFACFLTLYVLWLCVMI
jgi:hypothetical protein